MKTHELKPHVLELACPPLPVVRIGLIGVGQRGLKALRRYADIDGTEIRVVADLDVERLAEANRQLQASGRPVADVEVGEQAWQSVCRRDDVDLVYICTEWDSHAAMAVAALGAGADDPVVASIALCGALLHTLNHSLFKSLLYFGAGNLYSQMHTTLLDHFGGAAKRMPVTAALFLLATAAICALPPLNGFAGEFLIYLGMMDSVSNGVNVLYAVGGITALALIGGIVLLAFAKLFGVIFLGSPRHEGMNSVREVEGLRLGAMAIPAAGIIMAGLLPQYAVRVVSAAAAEFSPAAVYLVEADVAPTLTRVSLTAALLIILAALLYTVKVRAQRRRNVTQGPTWGCGFTAPDARMQYTGESFAEGLESLASTFNSDIVEGRVVDKGEIFPPAVRNYNVRHKDRVGRLFSAWWIEMLRMINQRIMRLRTGKINNYIFFALMFLVLVFVLSLFNIL